MHIGGRQDGVDMPRPVSQQQPAYLFIHSFPGLGQQVARDAPCHGEFHAHLVQIWIKGAQHFKGAFWAPGDWTGRWPSHAWELCRAAGIFRANESRR
jgi:hypothetical protein